MSLQLPEKPNLEYLRKQAKELLRNTQQISCGIIWTAILPASG